MSQDNVETVRRVLDAWNRGDREGWLAPSHPDVEWSSAIARELEGAGTAAKGHDALRRFWDEWHALWDVEIHVSEVRDAGDTVVALGWMRTRGRSSGAVAERPVGYVVEFEGGLVRRIAAYLSPEEALAVAGLSQ